MKRKASVVAGPPSAIALPPGAAKNKTYVEFHASMSLDNPTSALSFLAPSLSSNSSTPLSSLQQLHSLLPATYENTTLEQILKQRYQVWSQVHETFLNNETFLQQRETHLRTLQLALLHERNLRTSSKGLKQSSSGPEPAAQLVTDEPMVSTPSAPEPATLVEQLIESFEDFSGDDAVDLFQLAM